MSDDPRGRSAAAVSARKQRMLARLQVAAGEWVGAAELARAASVTPRSIRTYVVAINREHGPGTIESTALGYRLRAPSDAVSRVAQPDGRAERDRSILRALVRATDGADVYALAEALHVSDSTLESDLVRLRRNIVDDGVRIDRSGPTVRLAGEPSAVHALAARLVRREVEGELDVVSVLEEAYPHRDVRAFAEELDEALAAEGVEVNDYGFSSALLHIVVALDHAHPAGAEGTPLPPAVEATIRRHFGASLDHSSARELWRILDARALRDVAGEREREAVTLLGVIRARLESEHGARLDDAPSLDRFRLHLANLLRRARDGAFNANPWADAMRSHYPMVFELAVTAAHEAQAATGVRIPEPEVGFLAFHLGACLREQTGWDSPTTIAVHSPRYHDVGATLAERIGVDIGPLAEVVVVTSRRSTAVASGADVVVSTEAIADVDAVVVTPLYGPSDAAAVRRSVEQSRARLRARRVRANLLRRFDRSLFTADLAADSAEDAIRQLGALLLAEDVIDASDVERMLERERMASTAFLEGLAMPHTLGMHARRTAFAVGIARSPIAWDTRLVQVVVMLAVAHSDRDLFREAMDELTVLLLEPGAVRALQGARDFDAFLVALGTLLDR